MSGPMPGFERIQYGDFLHVDKHQNGRSAHVYERGKRVNSFHGPDAHSQADSFATSKYFSGEHYKTDPKYKAGEPYGG